MNPHDFNADFLPRDPDDQVGIIFKRLATYRNEFGPGEAFQRAIQGMLTSLGRAAHDEAERRGALLSSSPSSLPKPRRLGGDFDGWDAGDPRET